MSYEQAYYAMKRGEFKKAKKLFKQVHDDSISELMLDRTKILSESQEKLNGVWRLNSK